MIPGLRPTGSTLALLLAASLSQAIETPFSPFKDGYASGTLYNGNGRSLIVRTSDNSKAWISHALFDGAGEGLKGARLQIYVKDVVHGGQIKAYLASSLNALENQTTLKNLVTPKDSVGVATLRDPEDIQHVVVIPLAPGFLKS